MAVFDNVGVLIIGDCIENVAALIIGGCIDTWWLY